MAVRFVAAVTFQAPTEGNPARLNSPVGMVEFTEDAEGKPDSVSRCPGTPLHGTRHYRGAAPGQGRHPDR